MLGLLLPVVLSRGNQFSGKLLLSTSIIESFDTSNLKLCLAEGIQFPRVFEEFEKSYADKMNQSDSFNSVEMKNKDAEGGKRRSHSGISEDSSSQAIDFNLLNKKDEEKKEEETTHK